jgi:hypothetical protein
MGEQRDRLEEALKVALMERLTGEFSVWRRSHASGASHGAAAFLPLHNMKREAVTD